MTLPLPTATDPEPILVAALTPAGARLAARLAAAFPGAVLKLPLALAPEFPGAAGFGKVAEVFAEAFASRGHLMCVMATGIVVRHLAPLLKSKASDPAVVVLDEGGRFAISLLSGHLGGGNELARRAARAVGATPVITTATDVQGLPSLDALARRLGLGVENLVAVAPVHMALLRGEPVRLVDRQGILTEPLEEWLGKLILPEADLEAALKRPGPAVYVGVREGPFPEDWLTLRPRTLVVGVGCNRGTEAAEILGLITQTLAAEGLSLRAIKRLASIEAKSDEPGLLSAARELGVEIAWFTVEELKGVTVPHPSAVVARHMGVASVCEAAARRGADGGELLIPKRKSINVTVAVARAGWR